MEEGKIAYILQLVQYKCPTVFEQLISKFHKFEIEYKLLPHTKDLWVADFIPLHLQAIQKSASACNRNIKTKMD